MAAQDPQRALLLASIDLLSEMKSRAETRVKLARSLVADGELSADQLRRLQVLYADARGSVNAGLDRLLVDLETGGVPRSADAFRAVAHRAAKHLKAFLQASDAVIVGAERSGLVEAGLGAAEALASALVDVWKTLRGERNERRTALVLRIESFKWEPFDTIK